MTEKQDKVMQLLWNYHTLKEDDVIKYLGASKADIEFLIANRLIKKDNKTNTLQHRGRLPNEKNMIAFEVVARKKRCQDVIKSKRYPVIIEFRVENEQYAVIVLNKTELEQYYPKIDAFTKNTDKVYIIICTDKYIKEPINTEKQCLICTYPPLKKVDEINIINIDDG